MSKIAFSPNASGTGTFTVAAPNTNTSRTLTLPDADGTVSHLDAGGNLKWGAQGNGLLFSDANWGCIFKADRASPASAEFMWQNADGTERMRIDGNGNAGIGAGSGQARLRLVRNNSTTFTNAHIEMMAEAGDVIIGFHCSGASATVLDHVRGVAGLRVLEQNRSGFHPISASAFNTNSDYRLKENIEPLTDAAQRIAQIPVHRFSFVEGSMSYEGGRVVDGFLAHEVQAIVPEAITGEKDAVDVEGRPVYQSIDQAKLVPLLTAALQEALAKINQLATRIAALEGTAT